jgi:outer membrane protein
MKKFRIILISVFTFCIFHTEAQVGTAPNLPANWSLQDCIEYARKNNIQLNSLRLNSSSAGQDLLQAKAAKLPSVSASLSQSVVNGKQVNVAVGGFQSQADFSGNYGINSSLTLYNGGYLNNDIKAKELAVQSAGLSVEEAQNDITLSITESFLNILLSKENIKSLEEVLATSQAQLKQGQQRFDGGSISRKDLLQLQAQVAGDEYNLVNATNSYRKNTVTLKQVLQLPSDYDFNVAALDTLIVQQLLPPLSEAQNAALTERPEVKNDSVSVAIANTTLLKARAGALPTVSLGASLASGYANLSAGNNYFTQVGNNFYQSLGLNVGIPIFSKRVNKTNIEKSKIAIEQAKLALADTKVTLSSEVEQAYINVQNGMAQYQSAEAQLKVVKESYEITNEQQKLGALNMVDLQQQRSLYVQALQSYIQAKYSAVLYNKIYEFYMGMPMTF